MLLSGGYDINASMTLPTRAVPGVGEPRPSAPETLRVNFTGRSDLVETAIPTAPATKRKPTAGKTAAKKPAKRR
jgi:hypothetical protein